MDTLGNQVTYRCDQRGNRTHEEVTDPDGTLVRTLERTYDLCHRVAVINAAGSLTDLVFDTVGTLVQRTDPNANPILHSRRLPPAGKWEG